MKNKIIYVAVAVMLAAVLARAVQPVCSVEVAEGEYRLTVRSEDTRIPIATSTVKVPERLPIAYDSYFTGCIVFYADPQDSRPVQNTLVSIWGYPDTDWGVDVNTSEAGCFMVKIPADSNFTMKAMHPETKQFVKLGGTFISAGSGQLLNEAKDNIMPFNGDIVNLAIVTFEKGIKEHNRTDTYFASFTADLNDTEHSMVVDLPTVVNKEYVVTFHIDKHVKVYFSDSSRAGNPAIITNISDDVVLGAFKATKTRTRLYFQPQSVEKITIKSLSVKEVN